MRSVQLDKALQEKDSTIKVHEHEIAVQNEVLALSHYPFLNDEIYMLAVLAKGRFTVNSCYN